MKPAIIRSVVVLPQPEGPSSEKNSPLRDVEVEVVDHGLLAELLGQAAEAHGGGSAVAGSWVSWVSVLVMGVRLRR